MAQSSASGTIGNIYLADAQGDGNGVLGPVRANVRGTVMDLLVLGSYARGGATWWSGWSADHRCIPGP